MVEIVYLSNKYIYIYIEREFVLAKPRNIKFQPKISTYLSLVKEKNEEEIYIYTEIICFDIIINTKICVSSSIEYHKERVNRYTG